MINLSQSVLSQSGSNFNSQLVLFCSHSGGAPANAHNDVIYGVHVGDENSVSSSGTPPTLPVRSQARIGWSLTIRLQIRIMCHRFNTFFTSWAQHFFLQYPQISFTTLWKVRISRLFMWYFFAGANLVQMHCLAQENVKTLS